MTDLEEPGELFGVPVAPGTVMWNPTPAVDIGGLRMTPAADTADPSGVVALGGLSVRWGTDEPVDQAPPAMATVSLMDFTRRWAVEADRIGASVVLSWSTPLPSERVFFRGRITQLELTRVQVRRRDGSTVPAIRVDLTCTSLETDLANRYPAETSWPRENLGARAARLAAYCGGVADAVHVRSFWASSTDAAAVENVNKTSIRDLLLQLYTSCGGDRMIYSPQRRTYEHLFRRNATTRSMQRLWSPGPTNFRAGMGHFVAPSNSVADAFTATGVDTATPGYGLSMDADDLEYDEGMARRSADRITRVQLSYVNVTVSAASLSDKGRAAQAIADRIASGLPVFEDFTWQGSPQEVLNYNDELADQFYAEHPGSNWPANKANVRTWMLARVLAERKQGTTTRERRTVELVAPHADESYTGQRAVTFDSVHVFQTWAELNAQDLLASAVQENSTWRPGRFRWDTRRTGGLYNHALCELLLRGHQVGWPVSINRSWPASLGVRPVFSVTGGVITYEGSSAGRGRGWVIDIDAAGWGTFGGGNATPDPIKQHAITFEEIDDGTPEYTVRWRDDAHRPPWPPARLVRLPRPDRDRGLAPQAWCRPSAWTFARPGCWRYCGSMSRSPRSARLWRSRGRTAARAAHAACAATWSPTPVMACRCWPRREGPSCATAWEAR